jgi:hypothetical protein
MNDEKHNENVVYGVKERKVPCERFSVFFSSHLASVVGGFSEEIQRNLKGKSKSSLDIDAGY